MIILKNSCVIKNLILFFLLGFQNLFHTNQED